MKYYMPRKGADCFGGAETCSIHHIHDDGTDTPLPAEEVENLKRILPDNYLVRRP